MKLILVHFIDSQMLNVWYHFNQYVMDYKICKFYIFPTLEFFLNNKFIKNLKILSWAFLFETPTVMWLTVNTKIRVESNSSQRHPKYLHCLATEHANSTIYRFLNNNFICGCHGNHSIKTHFRWGTTYWVLLGVIWNNFRKTI